MSLVDVSTASETGAALRLFDAVASLSPLPRGIEEQRRSLPTVVNRSQAYYWTSVWQRDIEHSRTALAAGEYRDFNDPLELARWLLTEDD